MTSIAAGVSVDVASAIEESEAVDLVAVDLVAVNCLLDEFSVIRAADRATFLHEIDETGVNVIQQIN